ncbi:MAG: ATP-binding protein [Sphingobium sp.]
MLTPSHHRFALGLFAWLAVLLAAALAFAAALLAERDLAMVRLIAAIATLAAAFGLWRHVSRTNRMLARFVEAMRHGDYGTRFDREGGAGFAVLGNAMNAAMQAMQDAGRQTERDLRFLEALVDDVPVALLRVDEARGVQPLNKAARRLFDRHEGVRPEDHALYGASFARLLADPNAAPRRELLILTLAEGLQRALVHVAVLHRLDGLIHVIAVEPLQGTLDAIEVAAQTDLVRVLTHEILNSLTPILSLATTAEALLAETPPDPEGAMLALSTLDRRTRGLLSFIDAYRSVARSPQPRPVAFAASALASEVAETFRAEWPDCALAVDVEDGLTITADPGLLAQALINLLRNAGQATAHLGREGRVRLAIADRGGRIAMEVEDNGPGVPDAVTPDIFLPFFTTRKEGSGIGLNLVRQIVVASGGTIRLSTAAPHGARFTITL